MGVYFLPENNSFIPESWRDDGTYTDDSWPSGAILLDHDDEISFWRVTPPEGKKLSSTRDGRPCWVDIPPPQQNELVSQADATKEELQREAEDAIKPLERAKQLGIATEEELALLLEWEKYSVFLMRVDTSTAPDISWPQKP